MSLRKWCRDNWNSLPADVREKCLNCLDQEIIKGPYGPANLKYLRHYHENPNFHLFGGGMMTRNLLRRVLPDTGLPPVHTDHNGAPYAVESSSGNWDDYYTGAIDELLERYP